MEIKNAIKKSICIIKAHTTGLSTSKDRIVQLSIRKIDPNGKVVTGTKLFNPEMHIPEEATSIHGITDDTVSSSPTFFESAQKIYDFIGDSDISGFNVFFDIAFLVNEFSRANLDFSLIKRDVVDLKSLYFELNPRDFKSLVREHVNSEFDKDVVSSEEFVELSEKALSNLLEGRLIDNDIIVTHNTILNIEGRKIDSDGFFLLKGNSVYMNKGKHAGKLVSDVFLNDESYYEWMVRKAQDIPNDTKVIAERIFKKAKQSSLK